MPCKSLIDVGCDHGYLVQYALQNDLAERVTACDISAPSLEKANRLNAGDDRVRFVCADGATAAAGHDTVVIAGMGGADMMRIMRACSPNVFVLSPQTHERDVRALLCELGYELTADEVVHDKKFYTVLRATRGNAAALCETQLQCGAFCLTRRSEALVQKLTRELETLEKYPNTPAQKVRRAAIEEVLQWQLR